MGALEKFKNKMAEKRLIKELHPKLSPTSIQTGKDIEQIIRLLVQSSTRLDLPPAFSKYCRERYTAVTNAINFNVDTNFIALNKPSLEDFHNQKVSYKDCNNDFLTLIVEPEIRNVFVDKEADKNNLRIEKIVGHFQFNEKNTKIRFFRNTSELDTRSEDDEVCKNATILNNTWTVEPYFVTLPNNFLELYMEGKDYEADFSTILDYAIPPDDEIIQSLTYLLDGLVSVLYAINSNLDNYCRLKYEFSMYNLKRKRIIMPVHVLQYIENGIQGLNDNGRDTVRPESKSVAPRKKRVKHKRK